MINQRALLEREEEVVVVLEEAEGEAEVYIVLNLCFLGLKVLRYLD